MYNFIRFINAIFHTFPAFVFFLGLLMLPVMTGGDSGHSSSESAILDYDEISEYEGQALSSINDFRENSILEPQYIDQETYKLKISGLIENPIEYSYSLWRRINGDTNGVNGLPKSSFRIMRVTWIIGKVEGIPTMVLLLTAVRARYRHNQNFTRIDLTAARATAPSEKGKRSISLCKWGQMIAEGKGFKL